MASLGVSGDPDGWLHAGDTMNSVIQQLGDELGDADGGGGAGLRPHWYGPVADAYQDAWQQRRRRYDDLIGQAKPAVSAISDFGHRMLDFQARAADLERQWLHAGLVLTGDGLRFTLPAHASLVQDLKATLEPLLGHSERDIAEMWRDIEGAVQDLVSVLRSAASALEDYGFLEAAAIAGTVSFLFGWAKDTVEHPLEHLVLDPLDGYAGYLEKKVFEPVAKRADADKKEAQDLEDRVAKTADRDLTGDLKQLRDDTVKTAKEARVIADDGAKTADGNLRFMEDAEHGLLLVGVGITGYQTYENIHKEGLLPGVEDSLGGWAGLAVGIVAGAAIGTALGPVGVIVAASIISYGVSEGVQYEVSHHRKGVGQALTSVGQALTGIGHAATQTLTVPAAE